MERRTWSDCEIAILKARYGAGDVAGIARDISRSISSVHCKAFKLGLRKEVRPAHKICPRCNVSKPREEEFYERGNGSRGKRTESYCKVCCREIRALNPPPAERQRAQYHKHRHKRRAEMRAKSKIEVQTLAPTYIAKAIGMPRRNIPPELMQMKIDQIALRRLARLLKEASNEEHKDD